MKNVLMLLTVLMVGVCFVPVAPYAATEHLISFQGRATDDLGGPEASADVRVRIYDAATAGNLAYDSGTDFNNVTNVDGVFDILLGSGSVPLNLDNTLKYYMEIEINGEEVVGDAAGGRQEFLPGSGDHTHTHDADYVNVGESNSVTGGMIVDSTINSVKIQDNTITAADLIGTNCSDVCTDANTTDCASCDSRFVNVGEANSVSSTMIVDASITGADLYGTACSEICNDANTTDCVSCDSRFVNEGDLDHLDASDGSPTSAVYVDVNGFVGIGTSTPFVTLTVAGPGDFTNGSGDDLTYGVYGKATGYGGSTRIGGIFLGNHASDSNIGVGASAEGSGLENYGGSFSASGANTNYGVYADGADFGGYFKDNDNTASSDNVGVYGEATGVGTNINKGGEFVASGSTDNNVGVLATGTDLGVAGYGSTGVYGYGTEYGGIFWDDNGSGDDYGVWGIADGSGGVKHYGGYFSGTGATTNYGVYGTGTNYGVYGTGNTGVYGTGTGVGGYFINSNNSDVDYGVQGRCDGSGGPTHHGGYFVATGATSNHGVTASGTTCDFNPIGTGTDLCNPSSIRWKQNITEIDCALDKVANLQGVYFDWDEEHGAGRHDIGMVAEEVGKVVPEIVVYEQDGVYAQAMDYAKLTPLLIEAIKELKQQNDQLKELVCLDHPDAEVCQ